MLPSDASDLGARPAAIAAEAGPTESRRGRRSSAILGLAIVVVALFAGTGLFLSGYSVGSQRAGAPGTPASDAEVFAPFWEVYHAITERYAGGEVDRRRLVEGATKGLFEALGDPYSEYLTSDEYRDSLEGLSGRFEGIGAEIGTEAPDDGASDCSTLGEDCLLVVIAPIAGSPAEKAGLLPGDVVRAVDGRELSGLTVGEARDLIRGPKGTTVTLSIVRDGGDPLELAITRDLIETKEVTTRELAGGTVAYLGVSGFSDVASDQVAAAVTAARDKGITRFVLDLRGNPGGYVTSAQEIASQFIGSGPILWQESASGEQVATESTGEGKATGDDVEVAVLIDRGSASASEIVAGALQDRGRGTLVGENTFGKGTVQVWTELSNDAGGYRLTIAKWLTPDKRWVHGEGLEPDVAVTNPAAPEGADAVLDRALEILADSPGGALAPAA